MLSNLRVILSIGLGLGAWGLTAAMALAQFGLQIQIGGPYGGTGVYAGGFNVPFGVGPSIPPTSRAYMGPQYQSGYRGYYGNYGVGPSLGIYGSPGYGYGYSNPSPLDQLQLQQYALLRQQLELQAAQRRLSTQQAFPYQSQSRSSVQLPRVSSSTSDLRPGMVLPDGSTVLSVGPLSPASPASQQPSVATPVPQNVLPAGSSESKKAAF